MKKNLFLLTIDAFGADKYRKVNPHYTANIRRLGECGVTFTNAFSTTSSTTPSIASLHTGLYPFQHHIKSTYGWQLANSVQTLAAILKQNGYRTFATVGGPLTPATGMSRGFDRYVYRPAHRMLPFFKWRFPVNVARLNGFFLEREVGAFQQRKPPWFCWVHLLDLHNRWRPKQRRQNSDISAYETAIIHLNQKVRRLTENLNFDNTLVVVTADHGHHVAALDSKRAGIDYQEAHGFHVFDHLVQIPLILIANGLIPAGIEVGTQVSTVDVLPTVLNILDIEDRPEGPGKSFAALMNPIWERDGETYTERPIYMEACGSILKRQNRSFLTGIRNNVWKLVVSQDGDAGQAPELYHLKDDPDEQKNVYSQFPEVVRDLRATLDTIIAEKGRS